MQADILEILLEICRDYLEKTAGRVSLRVNKKL